MLYTLAIQKVPDIQVQLYKFNHRIQILLFNCKLMFQSDFHKTPMVADISYKKANGNGLFWWAECRTAQLKPCILLFVLPLHRYESVVIGNGLANQVSNPDVDVDITKPDIVIRSQIAALKEMSSWLKAAHSGQDISVENGEDGESVCLKKYYFSMHFSIIK